ncbi:UNVERIFIED_CONTAM: hypothetical protein Slati_2647300 [Sesamum latifolium]|uniref:Endonuclease/exonuclease/phosphatase domain-containing protein n=1 Tax=Sesamum latifolium TaxID=2727402 RepID=A0AAW2VW62_9LAMI
MEYASEAAPMTAPSHDPEDEERSHTDHQAAVSDVISEFNLHFIGLLEARVSARNVTRVQSFLSHYWKWFVDYMGPGTRIWLAWKHDEVVYGANDVYERRELWHSLVQLSDSISDEPWLVMGDFNMVVDLSEVCGISGDIHVVMEEFQECLSQIGLLTLPMQGDLYTWHNYSSSPRSLWKRLDRMLVNDRWLDRWPEASYSSLNPRTSDHSPLVLKGDLHRTPVRFFRFDNYLAASPDFIPTVQSIWRHHVVGTAMYSVTRKLKALKPHFRQQRKKKGDLSLNVKLAKEYLDIAQDLL